MPYDLTAEHTLLHPITQLHQSLTWNMYCQSNREPQDSLEAGLAWFGEDGLPLLFPAAHGWHEDAPGPQLEHCRVRRFTQLSQREIHLWMDLRKAKAFGCIKQLYRGSFCLVVPPLEVSWSEFLDRDGFVHHRLMVTFNTAKIGYPLCGITFSESVRGEALDFYDRRVDALQLLKDEIEQNHIARLHLLNPRFHNETFFSNLLASLEEEEERLSSEIEKYVMNDQ